MAKTFLSEDAQEGSLRPKTLSEYIGQDEGEGQPCRLHRGGEKARRTARPRAAATALRASARPRSRASLRQEMGVNIRITSGPAIEKAGDLAALLTNLSEGDILFVDEIHRLNRSVEEILYPAMEDYAIDIIDRQGPDRANSIRLDLPHFTLIGATTRAGQLSAPLRDRFGVTLRLELYTPAGACEDRYALGEHPECRHRPGRVRSRSRAARAARRVSRTACCAACAILRMCGPTASSRRRSRTKRSARSRSTTSDLDPIDHRMMHAIIENYGGGPVGTGDAGGDHRRGSRHAARTFTSRISCSSAFCSARLAGAASRARHMST